MTDKKEIQFHLLVKNFLTSTPGKIYSGGKIRNPAVRPQKVAKAVKLP